MMTSQAHFQSMTFNPQLSSTTAQQIQTPHSTMSDIDYVIAYICNDAVNEALPTSEFDSSTLTSEKKFTPFVDSKVRARSDVKLIVSQSALNILILNIDI